jgi:hypothetical protein
MATTIIGFIQYFLIPDAKSKGMISIKHTKSLNISSDKLILSRKPLPFISKN